MTRFPFVNGLALLVLGLSLVAMAAETKEASPATGAAEAKSPADASRIRALAAIFKQS